MGATDTSTRDMSGSDATPDVGGADAATADTGGPDASQIACGRGIIRNTCAQSGCHDGSGGNGFNLSGDVPSATKDVHVANASCTSRVYVDSSDISNSFILDKISNDSPECGSRMPFGMTPLTPSEIACMRAYLESL